MPNLNASDYTTFVKLQAASLAYQNGKVPVPIQRVSQPVPTQSILNAQLLASKASYLAASPGIVTTTSPSTVTAVSTNTVTDAASNILSAATTNIITRATGSSTYITYTTTVPHGLAVGDTISVTNLPTYTLAQVTSQLVATVPSTVTFTVLVASAGTTDVTSQAGQIKFGAATNLSMYYTSSVAHGLTASQVITVRDFTVYTVPNVTSTAITRVINSTSFFIANDDWH